MVTTEGIMAKTQLIPEWKAAVDEIWAMMKETDRRMKETDRRMKETDRQMQETDKRIEKSVKEMEDLKKTVERVTGNVGGLNRSLGELIETLIAARLWEKFPDYNLKRAYQRVPIFDEDNRIMTDIDILLSDTGLSMAVEVKRELDRTKDVDEHLKRMELVRKHPPAEVAGKKLLGAMAGGVVDADVRRYAWESGFFVLELTGESVRLVPPPEGFEPRQW
jgi:chromosome segregation ATPase